MDAGIEAAARLGLQSQVCAKCGAGWLVSYPDNEHFAANLAAHIGHTHQRWACTLVCARYIVDAFAKKHGGNVIYAYVTDGWGSPVMYDVKPAYDVPPEAG